MVLASTIANGRRYHKMLISATIIMGVLTLVTGLFILTIQAVYEASIGSSEDIVEKIQHPSQWQNIVVDYEGQEATPSDHKCHHHSCFDVYRCGKAHRITVYIYPMALYVDEDGVEINPISKEFLEIINAVAESPYYTSNPEEACLFFPTIDTLNENNLRTDIIGRALASLPHWKGGKNHLLFNFLPGSAPHFTPRLGVERGKAMVAGAGYSSFTFRTNFDVSLPVFNPTYNHLPITKNTISQRPWYLVSSQVNLHREYYEELLSQVPPEANQKDLLLLHLCSDAIVERLETEHEAKYMPDIPFSKLDFRCRGSEVFKYPEIMEQSQFCLVSRGGRLGQPVLYDSLRAGCVPVVVADTLVLPFSDVLDWRIASIQIYEDDLPEVLKILHRDVSTGRLQNIHEQVKWIYSEYFSSIKKLTMTTLDIINERVFATSRKSIGQWNTRPHEGNTNNPLFLPLTAPANEGFTAVILTYDRPESLQQVIQMLSSVPSCVKILVVWNNQYKDPPPGGLGKSVTIVKPPSNRLSNRFFPYHQIETQAILALDDDINMMTSDELEYGYHVWREFPDRIVGFPSRNVIWNNITNSWKYDSEWTNEVSLVLTGVAFYHKYWNYVYTTEMFPNIREWVDDHMNCEDIAINFLVANRTGKAPIKVAPRKKFKCGSCSSGDLSATEAHMLERSECVNFFSGVFGSMPLKAVEFRADPLLYLDNFPEKLKMYKDIGSL